MSDATKIERLKMDLAAVRAQREKIRATRDTLKVKLTGEARLHALLARSHFDLWHEYVHPRHDTALPPAELAEHISYKRGLAVDAGVGLLHEGYIAVQQIKQALAPHTRGPVRAILDFGCGCGRLTRYMNLLGEAGARCVGCDVDAPAIEWSQKHLPNSGTFFTSSDRPPILAVEKGTFDLIVALSVFTHLPEDMQDAWLAELMSLLRPGGLLLATFHGPYYHRFVPEELREKFGDDGFVHCDLGKTRDLPDYYLTTFHTTDYIKARWSRFGELAEIVPMAVQLQDAAILRRPE